MNDLLPVVLPVAVSLGTLYWLWKLNGRCTQLRRRVAAEETQNRLLRGRLDDAAALFEARLSRLEGVAGSRSKQRRRAAELVRLGGDPLAAAKRCELPAVELQVLMQLDELRARRPVN